MAEEKKLTLYLLAQMVKETNDRIDALAQVVTQRHESQPLDEGAIVEKVQSQLARSLLPAIEQLQSNLKQVGSVVVTMQTNLDTKIQTQVESIFKQNQQAINDALAAKIEEMRQAGGPISASGGTPAASNQSSTMSLVSGFFNAVFAAAQTYPEGAKMVAGFIRPTPPPQALLMDQIAMQLRSADTILKMQKAVAAGQDVDEILAAYKKKTAG